MTLELKVDRIKNLLVRRSDWDFWITLFPLSKWHLEEILMQVPPETGYTDSWYRERVLSSTPRFPFNDLSEPWRPFVTGLLRKEVEALLDFIGAELPKEEEWLLLASLEGELKNQKGRVLEFLRQGDLTLPFEPWVKAGIYPLTSEGFLEHVKDDRSTPPLVKVIGKPFYSLYPNLWSYDKTRYLNEEMEEIRRVTSFRYVIRDKG